MDLFKQRHRLRFRFDAHLLGQHLATAVVLGNGGGTLPASRQAAHDPAMHSFQPRLQGQLPAGVLERTLIVTSGFGCFSKLGQGVHGLEM